jgi:mitotic spindle assembly checkpoint protein MAD1
MLEKTVNGYKELCAKLETELAEVRGHPGQLDGVIGSDQYQELRKDLDSLRTENEKLKKRKNELEIEIENLTLRHNVMGSDDRYKVVHFKMNPTAIAQEQVANELVKLKAEVERLRMRNKKLEAGNEDLTTRVNETMNMTMNVKELSTLRDEHKTLQAKYKENEIIFSNVNQEMREVIYMLFGFKLDRFGNSNYRFVVCLFIEENNPRNLIAFPFSESLLCTPTARQTSSCSNSTRREHSTCSKRSTARPWTFSWINICAMSAAVYPLLLVHSPWTWSVE